MCFGLMAQLICVRDVLIKDSVWSRGLQLIDCFFNVHNGNMCLGLCDVVQANTLYLSMSMMTLFGALHVNWLPQVTMWPCDGRSDVLGLLCSMASSFMHD